MLLFVSTIAKYDFYTDVIFAAVLYRKRHEQEVEVLCCLAIIFLILPSVVNVIQTFTLVASEIRYRLARKKSFKTLRCINFYAKLFIIMEHESIAWFLDKFAANTANKIGTIYIPQKIISSFFKVTLENMPQLVIQLTYQLQIATEYNFTLIVTTISTCASLVLQVFVFMLAKSSFTDEIEIAKMSQRFGKGGGGRSARAEDQQEDGGGGEREERERGEVRASGVVRDRADGEGERGEGGSECEVKYYSRWDILWIFSRRAGSPCAPRSCRRGCRASPAL